MVLEFQRDVTWDEERQSRPVEPVIIRILLPVFYLAENEEGTLVVVDGLSRLTMFTSFLNNELALLHVSSELRTGSSSKS